ncbi:MAG: DNA alkylation repair protein, partial [Candidatus Azambacteria bacterium]|nr:DNA alkylation repair protein [Candidatus Azambacteria bacterium]
MTLKQLIADLNVLANPEKAKFVAGYFKTGKGQYGEGDVFLGLTVPAQRKIAKKYLNLTLLDLEKLIHNKIHEHRLTGLMILYKKFNKAQEKERKKIYKFYLKNTKWVNNWDLVDLSAREIIGGYLLDKNRKILYKLAKSNNLWERRIAVISTFAFIRNRDFKDTLKIAEILLHDKHDLIHKAVGWMLREI